MSYDNIESIWRHLLIKADISLVSDFWFEAPKKFFYSTNLKDIESMRFCQNILSPFWASFFKNLNFFHFSRHMVWLVCRTVMLFLLVQRYKLCKLFRYLEHARKVHRNVSRGFSKKSFAQKNEVLSEYSILILCFIFLTKPLFFEQNFFLKSL